MKIALLKVPLYRLPGSMSSLLLLLIQDQLAMDITVPIFEVSQNANGIASMILLLNR